MIQVYLPGNENYQANGDMTIVPTSCQVESEVNGVWSLTLEHPIDIEGRWTYIQNEGVVEVPLFDKKQLFIIRGINKKDSGITVEAEPIFMKSRNDCILKDIRPTDKNGQQALDIITSGTQYSGTSNITDISTAYYQRKNLIEAIQSDDANSFLNRWGGEVYYNNFNIIINSRIGRDRGVSVAYGRNIQQNGFEEDIDTSDVITRIYPVAYNGRVIEGETDYVDSPLIDNYPSPKARYITYSDIKLRADAENEDENSIICENQNQLNAELKKRAEKEYSQNNVDKPKVNIKVDLVLLENTVLYQNFKDLERLELGDDVKCHHSKLGIDTVARIIKCTYDCILEKTVKCVIGEFQYNYLKEAASITQSIQQVIDTSNKTLMANRITGVINLLTTSLRAQKDIAQRQDVRALLFEDLDSNSPTFGALCIGTQGLQISKERNPANTDWQWGTAINFKSIIADYIIAGILTDREGKFYLNLDTGELRMRDGTFVGTITGSTIQGGTIEGAMIKGSHIFSQRNREKTYTQNDAEKIKQYILGNTELTDDEKKHLDINQDGVVSIADNLSIRKLLGGSQSVTVQIKDTVKIHYEDSQIEVASSFHNATTGRTMSYSTVITGANVSSDSVFSDDVYTRVVEFLNDSMDFGVKITLPKYSVNGVRKDVVVFYPTEKTGLPKYVINFTDRTAGFEG